MLLFSLSQPVIISAAEKPDVQHYQKNLDRVQQGIAKVKEHLQGTRYKRGHLVTELKQLEEEISKNARILSATNAEISRLGKRISNHKTELGQLNTALGNQREALAEQLRSAYALGQQHSIKMLLNQHNPAEIGRIQVYFEYLNRAREQQITDFIQSVQRKQVVETELNEALSGRKQAQAEQVSQKRQLEGQRFKRTRLLANLDSDIRNQEKTLTELESSRNKIENLLMSLGELLADIPASPNDKQAFGKQKGHLPWPVKGPFLAKYGNAKPQGDMKWKGVLIGTDYGTPVKAVSHGQIAFSDWLQGYGFITIIDHGDGYMSLYGHNESLFKQAGDWVAAGEVIATSGDSGGQPKPGLYFEIRSRGKPVNPSQWCSARAAHPASG
ncbi:MAG: peptidoglycan DD-metalloendopeptidase family protein [Gammaproteobacteria bacterium]